MSRISNFKFQISNRLLIALISCLTTAGACAAEEVPTITVSKGDRINLSVSALSGSEGAATT